MKRVFLISFYFTPCTLTPSQRITYWAKNFHKIGFYPIIITREWNDEIRSHSNTKIPLGINIRHEKYENFEVYYLPFKPGILDKAYLSWGENFLRPLFLLVKVLDVFLASFTLRFTSYANFFPLLKKLAKELKVNRLIISGEPFYLFKVGYLANKRLGMDWIADYRDDWSTNELQLGKSGGGLRKLLLRKESNYEKKWVGTASHIISVSDPYTRRIAAFVGKQGITIQNGFEEALLDMPEVEKYPDFTIAYSGVLYPSQDISILLKALQKAKAANKPFYLIFLGTGFDIKEKKRIESLVDEEIKEFVKVTDRYPRNEAIQILKKCHGLVSIAYGDMKGIPSSKLYEYLALKTPILLCPSDGDIMEDIVLWTNTGFICNDSESLFNQIEVMREDLLTFYKNFNRETNYKKISSFSRMSQMQKIKSILNG